MHPPCPEGFEPQPQRGTRLDARMHAELAASLAHLAEAAEPVPALSGRIGTLARRIGDGERIRPLGFHAYFRLVLRLSAQDLAGAEAELARIEALAGRAPARTLTHFGAPEADQISLALIEEGMRLAPITAAEAEAFARLLDDGLALMQAGLPELHAELTGIIHEVLLARAPQGDRMEFDGASHYQFWGMLLLNPKHHRTPLAVVEVLAHEASHALLFGMTIEEPLVLNPDDELYPSPLRLDPRPMDGIYHATYVSARMAWAMERLAASGLLSAEDRSAALAAACTDRDNHARGLSVIDAHGRLSPTGARILDSARAWTDAA